ncbi:hypothetical protein [Microbacterium sp. CPCC 204701]|uniref:hypothetical protein n=1 Tax=Microbacterium sp. CPCC 204701 TaxID=2493084 RepID=UPI000FD83C2B|nr:hypothetical protein [Microbacterium sp. CPCC 204701]
MKRALTAVVAIALVVTLSACMGTPAPTYDEVHDEAVDAMKRIADTLPGGTEIDDRSRDPDACELGSDVLLSGDGLYFTGHWVAQPGSDFDSQKFIDELPDKLGDDFLVDDTAVDVSFPAVRLRPTNSPDVLIDVAGSTPSEEPFIDILVISRCGASPAS